MFYVGQKVVCVDDGPSIKTLDWEWPVRKNEIYTIAATGLLHPDDPKGRPCVLLIEVERTKDEPLLAIRFRPLVERRTDIGFAHEILRKATKRKPATV